VSIGLIFMVMWTAASVALGLLIGACINYADQQETFDPLADQPAEVWAPAEMTRRWVA
jgi:ABC-type microcin C transport system permease subunit YejE